MGSEKQGRETTLVDDRQWPQFHGRRGTGPQPFAQRLARARLLFLRRRETAANWLALLVVLFFQAEQAFTSAAPPLQVSPQGDAIVANNSEKPLSHSLRSR
jgi:hypothetical protein